MSDKKAEFNAGMDKKRAMVMKTGHIMALAALSREGMEALATKMQAGERIGPGALDKKGDVNLLMNCFAANEALQKIVCSILDEMTGAGVEPEDMRH